MYLQNGIPANNQLSYTYVRMVHDVPLDANDLLQLGELLHHHHAVVGALVGLADEGGERPVQQVASMVHVPFKSRGEKRTADTVSCCH